MSLRDHEARAMAIRALNEAELRRIHADEMRTCRYLLPYEIAAKSSAIARSGGSIRKHWGIPEAPAAQAAHAERVGNDITNLIRAKKCGVNIADDESRINFDWHIQRSNLDFAYHGVSQITTEHDPFT